MPCILVYKTLLLCKKGNIPTVSADQQVYRDSTALCMRAMIHHSIYDLYCMFPPFKSENSAELFHCIWIAITRFLNSSPYGSCRKLTQFIYCKKDGSKIDTVFLTSKRWQYFSSSNVSNSLSKCVRSSSYERNGKN